MLMEPEMQTNAEHARCQQQQKQVAAAAAVTDDAQALPAHASNSAVRRAAADVDMQDVGHDGDDGQQQQASSTSKPQPGDGMEEGCADISTQHQDQGTQGGDGSAAWAASSSKQLPGVRRGRGGAGAKTATREDVPHSGASHVLAAHLETLSIGAVALLPPAPFRA